MKTPFVVCTSTALILAALIAASGPASAASPHRQCFWPRSVQNLTVMNDRTVFARVQGREVFRLELFTPCRDIDWSRHMDLRSRTGGTICEGRGLGVELVARTSRGRHRRCSVGGIRRLTPDEVAALPARARP